MFVSKRAWLQIVCYVATNVLLLAYLAAVRPYTETSQNRLRIFNELISLCIAYMIAWANDLRHGPDANVIVVTIISCALYFAYAVTLFLALAVTVKEILRRRELASQWRWRSQQNQGECESMAAYENHEVGEEMTE